MARAPAASSGFAPQIGQLCLRLRQVKMIGMSREMVASLTPDFSFPTLGHLVSSRLAPESPISWRSTTEGDRDAFGSCLLAPRSWPKTRRRLGRVRSACRLATSSRDSEPAFPILPSPWVRVYGRCLHLRRRQWRLARCRRHLDPFYDAPPCRSAMRVVGRTKLPLTVASFSSREYPAAAAVHAYSLACG